MNIKNLSRGIFKENPTFVLVLGMCPTLGVSTQLVNALGMGGAATFVLICSNVFISLLRKVIPESVRIPAYISIIATFVTLVKMIMHAYLPSLYSALGVYLDLIVVNCIILGRAEAFASKNSVGDSLLDAVGMGVGFTLSLSLIALIREVLGSGTITLPGYQVSLGVLSGHPLRVMVLPAGALLLMGYLKGFFNWKSQKEAA